MAIWRFFKVLLLALIIFIIVNFFYSNLTYDSRSLATPISFKFNVPPFPPLESVDFPVGYLLLLSFILGMIVAALIGALNAFSRSREIKMKNRTIRELEGEINELRASQLRDRHLAQDLRFRDEPKPSDVTGNL